MKAKLMRAGVVTLLGAASLLVSVPLAAAKPTVTFTPEFSSGALAGPGSIAATLKLEGTEYGGFPPPILQVLLRLPAGTTVNANGHPTCSQQTLEQVGPSGCPATSAAGPVGTARGIVSFGSERVEEQATVQSFFAPGGGLNFFLNGHSPVSLEILASATVAGNVITMEVPLVSTVPGAPYASFLELSFALGETEAEEESSQLASGVTLPAECPTGGFSWSAAVTFDEGGTNPPVPELTEQAAGTGCLARQEPLRGRRAAEALARRHAEEEAAAKKKSEEEAALQKRHKEEAELVALRARVKRLEEELKAAVKVEKVKITGHHVIATVKTSEPGVVTITGAGLKKLIRTLAPGTHRLTMTLTRAGRGERRAHERIKLAVSLKVDGRRVSASREVRL